MLIALNGSSVGPLSGELGLEGPNNRRQKYYEYGLVNGYNDGMFRPDDEITREKAMAMVARAMQIAKLKTGVTEEEKLALLSQFDDRDKVSEWAEDSVAAVIKYNIVNGHNGLLRPDEHISRAETAAMVMRMLEKAELI